MRGDDGYFTSVYIEKVFLTVFVEVCVRKEAMRGKRIMLLIIVYIFFTLNRAKKGRALCTWQPFMDASHALRSSSKMVPAAAPLG